VIGEIIGNFEVVSRLGEGGMGEIWLAEQRSVRTKVAIKLLRAAISMEQSHVRRFFNEAVAAGKIHHPGVVRIFDVGFHADGQAYLVMEYLEGETLAQRVQRKRRLPIAQVVDIGRQIASVLEATHAANITHRDLKPDNIFLTPDAELPSGERVKVLDFGIAKLGDSVGVTSSQSALGTPLYMSPEQWRNPTKADSRSDVYSLGCVVFEMLCGRPPFQASSLGEACTKHLSQPPPVPHTIVSDLPVGFDDLVLRMLKKKPASRPTIREITDALATIAEAVPAERARASAPSVPPPAPSNEPADPHASTLATGVGSEPSPAAVTARTPRTRVVPVLIGLATVGAAAAVIALRPSERVAESPPALAVKAPPERRLDQVVTASEARPPLVSSKSLVRIGGSTPQPRTNVQLTYCIDIAGTVTSIDIPEDVAPDVANDVRKQVAAWRHEPFKRAGKATPVCAMTMLLARPPPRPTTAVAAQVDAHVAAPTPAPAPPTAPELPAGPDSAAIAAGLAAVKPQIQSCGTSFNASGRIVIHFEVDAAGRVSTVNLEHANIALRNCLRNAIANARFAPTREGGVVDYPITFH
jgi:serine/threonine protein kinase